MKSGHSRINKRRVVGVFVVIKKNNKILFVLRRNMPYINKWSLPGGKIKKNETLMKAAIREVSEETNLDVQLTRLCGFVDFKNDVQSVIDYRAYIFECIPITHELKPSSDAKMVQWIGKKDFSKYGVALPISTFLKKWYGNNGDNNKTLRIILS